MPSAAPTAATSSITARASSMLCGVRAISPRVAPVSAVVGLNATLPTSFSHSSRRTSSSTGQRRPPAAKASAIAWQRALMPPAGSPMVKRVPSTCWTTPGATSSVGRVRDAADHPPRLDRRGDRATGIDGLQHRVPQRPVEALEEPPRHAVLRRQDRRVGIEQRREARRELREAVGLDAEHDQVDPGARPRARRVAAGSPSQVAARRAHPQAVAADRVEVRAAGDQHDVGAAGRQRRAQVAADRTRADDRDPHHASPKCSAMRGRCTLPVGVRGMVSTMWTTSGTLKAASRSRQCRRSASASTRGRPARTARADDLAVACRPGCRRPTAWATPGCSSSTASTSSGEMFSPPRMMISLRRPTSRGSRPSKHALVARAEPPAEEGVARSPRDRRRSPPSRPARGSRPRPAGPAGATCRPRRRCRSRCPSGCRPSRRRAARAAAGWPPSRGSPRSCRTPPASARRGSSSRRSASAGRMRRAAGADEAQPRALRHARRARRRAASGGGRARRVPGDAGLAEREPEAARRHAARRHDRAAGHERRERRGDDPVHVEQRHRAVRDVLAGRARSGARSSAPRPAGCGGAAAPASAGWWCRSCAAAARRRRASAPCRSPRRARGARERGRPVRAHRQVDDRHVRRPPRPAPASSSPRKHEQRARLEVVEVEGELGAAVGRVERSGRGAERGDREQQLDELRPRPEREGDAVAAPDAERASRSASSSTAAASCAYVRVTSSSGTTSAAPSPAASAVDRVPSAIPGVSITAPPRSRPCAGRSRPPAPRPRRGSPARRRS